MRARRVHLSPLTPWHRLPRKLVSVAMQAVLVTGLLVTLLTPGTLRAATAASPVLSTEQEQRADKLAHGLRCLVCQNQTLAESNAPLALDMRKLIRGQLAEGKTDTEIMRFFEDRYGDFVRYDPPFKPITWLLWVGPFALLAVGFLVLVRTLKRRAGTRAPLTADERARAARFLDSGS
ncbi:cytochrome c-type biogenesis protein [Achromobacter animicus]|uniref:cytochrome c-type biogenesis protein n=1 Tax=Achromobacter animicus TaxID=1389935 RepID=UPI0028A793C2|nr:cytochrome c-type biogenesis protein [Achromobacter animicus]